jgi:hypothetical protein
MKGRLAGKMGKCRKNRANPLTALPCWKNEASRGDRIGYGPAAKEIE